LWNPSDDFLKAWGGGVAGAGSFTDILSNGYMIGYSGVLPANANLSPTGIAVIIITLNGDPFVPGVATNGINLGVWDGLTLKRAIDPVTSSTEIWRGAGLDAAGTGTTVGYFRYFANADSTTIRMDGVAATSGGDITMANGTTIVSGVNSEVSDVSFDFGAF
jgi:hypothetical protein